VDFDKTKHLTDKNIKKRRMDRERLEQLEREREERVRREREELERKLAEEALVELFSLLNRQKINLNTGVIWFYNLGSYYKIAIRWLNN